jgi:hypothetical protein
LATQFRPSTKPDLKLSHLLSHYFAYRNKKRQLFKTANNEFTGTAIAVSGATLGYAVIQYR